MLIKLEVKLVEFGCSERLTNKLASEFYGKNEYAAPEILTGGFATQKSDVWSIGVVCFELLYGHLPDFGLDYSNDVFEVVIY